MITYDSFNAVYDIGDQFLNNVELLMETKDFRFGLQKVFVILHLLIGALIASQISMVTTIPGWNL